MELTDANLTENCPWYRVAGEQARIATYYVITPFYVIMALFGHVTCLIAFYRQSKKESAYMYQVFVVISETMEIITYLFYSSCFHWFSGADGHSGQEWFTSNYYLMRLAAHVSTPLVNMFVTTSALLSVSVVADRVFAIAKPFKHKNINHKKHQICAFCFCLSWGVLTSIFDCFRFNVESKNGSYRIMQSEAFIKNQFASGLAHVRSVTYIIGLISLITLNIALLRLHHLRVTKVTSITQTQNRGRRGSDQEMKRKENEKTLTFLALCQSCLNSVSMILLTCYYVLIYTNSNFFDCQGPFYTPILDGIFILADMIDFYVFFVSSKKFRQMVFASVPCCKRFVTASN